MYNRDKRKELKKSKLRKVSIICERIKSKLGQNSVLVVYIVYVEGCV